MGVKVNIIYLRTSTDSDFEVSLSSKIGDLNDSRDTIVA